MAQNNAPVAAAIISKVKDEILPYFNSLGSKGIANSEIRVNLELNNKMNDWLLQSVKIKR